MKNRRRREKYFNSDDYMNLAFVALLLIIVLQATVRIFFINEIVFKLINIVTVGGIFIGLLFVILAIRTRRGKYTISKEDAKLILERYVREHKYSKVLEEYETAMAIAVLLGENTDLEVVVPESAKYEPIVSEEDNE